MPTPPTPLPPTSISASQPALELSASLSMGSASQHWASERRMALLDAIDTEGSISAGARRIGLSYKAAWDAVDAMNTLAGEALVERTSGGARGGGAQLTPRARKLLALYRSLNQAHARFVAQLNALAREAAPDLDLIRHLTAPQSVRNKLTGTVSGVVPAGSQIRVTVRIDDQTEITAQTTPDTARALGLGPGLEILLFIDASAIVIGLTDARQQLSARNQIQGRIRAILQDTHSVQIELQLPGGHCLVAALTPESVETLQLQPGKTVRAIFKASAVTLGRKDADRYARDTR